MSSVKDALARVVTSRAGGWFERNSWRIGVSIWGGLMLVQAWRHRDDHWNWLLSASLAFAGLTIVALGIPRVRQNAAQVRLFAGGLIALGLTLVGVPSGDPNLTVALLLALAGPALVVFAAQTVAQREERTGMLERDARAARVQDDQLRNLIHLTQIASANERRRMNGRRRIAGWRRLQRPDDGLGTDDDQSARNQLVKVASEDTQSIRSTKGAPET